MPRAPMRGMNGEPADHERNPIMPKVSKTHIAIAAIAAVGGVAYLNSAKSVGLSCETTDTTTTYFNKNSSPYKEGPSHGTMVVQLSGSTWRFVSLDGHPLQQMAEEAAKSNGKPFRASDLDMPLRTTAEAYTLFDLNQEKIEGDYKTHNRAVIDRLTGAIDMWTQTINQKEQYSTTSTSVGKCSPIAIQANL